MHTSIFENLDLACAKTGKTIAEKTSKELENLITNSLAVLEEQGIYAMFLFLKSRGGKTDIEVSDKIKEFLQKTPKQLPLLPKTECVFKALEEIANDLDKLLLARDLARQTLIYARYHVRALKDK